MIHGVVMFINCCELVVSQKPFIYVDVGLELDVTHVGAENYSGEFYFEGKSIFNEGLIW